jgi:hypothetical protein
VRAYSSRIIFSTSTFYSTSSSKKKILSESAGNEDSTSMLQRGELQQSLVLSTYCMYMILSSAAVILTRTL